MANIKMPVGKLNDFVTVGMQLLYDRAGTIAWTINLCLSRNKLS